MANEEIAKILTELEEPTSMTSMQIHCIRKNANPRRTASACRKSNKGNYYSTNHKIEEHVKLYRSDSKPHKIHSRNKVQQNLNPIPTESSLLAIISMQQAQTTTWFFKRRQPRNSVQNSYRFPKQFLEKNKLTTCNDVFTKLSTPTNQINEAKETQTTTKIIQDLEIIVKNRGDNIIGIEELMKKFETSPKNHLQSLENLILKIGSQEQIRIMLEKKKLQALEGIQEEERKILLITSVKKEIKAFERKSLICQANIKRKPNIEEQLYTIMQDDIENTDKTKTKKKFTVNKSLEEILGLAFSEQKLDLYFIYKIIAIYSRIILEMSQKKMMEAFCKESKTAMRIRIIPNKQLVPEVIGINQQFIQIKAEKAYNFLMANNSKIEETITRYRVDYFKRHDLIL